jgi:hypothetical protein
MTVPMERVENRILSVRGLRRQGFLGANLGANLGVQTWELTPQRNAPTLNQ